MISVIKIIFGIAVLRGLFECGATLFTACSGLFGLYLILDGLTGAMSRLGSLLKTDSTISHPQNPV